MKILRIKSKPVDASSIGEIPSKGHFGTVIDEDVMVYVDDKPALMYKIMSASDTKDIRHICENSKMTKSQRVNGVPTKSAVFGALPASPSRSTCFCRFSRPTHEQRTFLPAITRYAALVDQMYAENFPDRHAADMEWVTENVDEDWRWLPGPYQTFNINTNFAIPYHRDSGNIKGSYSNVLILTRKIKGGELVCPELGITLSQRDNAWTLFNGEGLLHGVSPIEYLSPASYRSSIVLYTLKGMATCGPISEELVKTRALLTKRARMSQADRIAKVKSMNKRFFED